MEKEFCRRSYLLFKNSRFRNVPVRLHDKGQTVQIRKKDDEKCKKKGHHPCCNKDDK